MRRAFLEENLCDCPVFSRLDPVSEADHNPSSETAPQTGESFEKQNHRVTKVGIRKKLDSSATGFAFQGFWSLESITKLSLQFLADPLEHVCADKFNVT